MQAFRREPRRLKSRKKGPKLNNLAEPPEVATAAQSEEINVRPRPITRMRLPLFWLAIIALVGGGCFWWFSHVKIASQQDTPKSLRGTNQPQSVAVAKVSVKDVAVYLSGLGSVTALNTVAVHSRVDGQLMRVVFTEGQSVKAGDLLAEIDPRPYQVQLTQAQGQLAKDQALVRNAQLDLQRYKTLFAQDSIAKQQVDTQASLVRQYEGALKADQGQIDSAKLNLTYTKVTAPAGGRLGLRQVDPGNVVHAGDANGIVVITQFQPINVMFTIPEDSVPTVMKKLQAGEKLAVDAFDRAGRVKLASGVLVTVDSQIDASTGTLKLKAQFPNEDSALFPNQFVNARMLLDVKRDVATIPTAAIQRGTQGTFVYVIKGDNTVTVRPTKLGPIEGDNAAIESGLTVGELVVLDGADKLKEGAHVIIASRDRSQVNSPAAAAKESDKKNDGSHHRRREGADADKAN